MAMEDASTCRVSGEMQPTGLERRVQPNGAPRTSNDERRSTSFIVVRHSTVSRGPRWRIGRRGGMRTQMPSDTRRYMRLFLALGIARLYTREDSGPLLTPSTTTRRAGHARSA